MLVPVYQGKMPKELIERVKGDTDSHSIEIINDLLKKGSIKLMKDPVVAVVKVVDNQRSAHFLKKLYEITPGKRFLSIEQRKTHVYNKPSESAERIIDLMQDLGIDKAEVF